MAVQKNQCIPLEITGLTSEGSGVGRYEGEAVFVPGTAPGDRITARIVKDCKRYAYGIVDKLEQPGPGRREEDCPICRPCGGCCFRHLTYEAELEAKKDIVLDAFRRIGGLELPIDQVLASPQEDRYRNKVQFPVQKDEQGHTIAGFYAGRSHRIIPCEDCLLQPAILNQIAQAVCSWMDENGVSPYDEASHTGLVRHIFLRRGTHSGQIMLCLVINGHSLPHSEAFCSAMLQQFPEIQTILLNVNTQRTNVITGLESISLYGPGYIEDTMCGVPVRLGPLSFYQVNTPSAERLYALARQYAQLKPTDRLLDLYCGMGTIGLSMAQDCADLVGVEIIPEAVESARQNAARMGVTSRFLCADAGQAASQLAAEGLAPDVILLDPPRKGCDSATLDAVCTMAPRRVVMISCNPATAARDVRYLADHGYQPERLSCADLFARTKHVETVVLLSQQKPDDTIEIDLDLDELDATTAETKATYEEIKAYVWDKHHLKVSSLYISQVKRKCGLEVGQNYNLSKSENPKVPKCPPEKEAVIMGALKHFQMI